jgi:hypothetical protein
VFEMNMTGTRTRNSDRMSQVLPLGYFVPSISHDNWEIVWYKPLKPVNSSDRMTSYSDDL